jgi:hypothetical protein
MLSFNNKNILLLYLFITIYNWTMNNGIPKRHSKAHKLKANISLVFCSTGPSMNIKNTSQILFGGIDMKPSITNELATNIGERDLNW